MGARSWAAAFLFAAPASANEDVPLDRPYTLRNAEPAALEREYHRMLRDPGPDSYAFPRACLSAVDSSRVCGGRGLWRFRDEARGRGLDLSPVLGLEYRRVGDEAGATDLGLLASGRSGAASFLLDGRIFTEVHSDPDHPSYDREYVERQDEEQGGGTAYSSYARFRSSLSYDWDWGRISAGRDAAHWGPAQFGNLVFHQDAVPFNQLSLTAHLGPFTVRSLYGQLLIPDREGFSIDSLSRSVYAHRYELRLGTRTVLAVNEQLILFNQEAPFAFAPIVPLFMAKGVDHERSNNGNISGDVAWTVPGRVRLYSEFLIDDLQSPAGLFDDFWGNKWAALGGVHGMADFRGLEAGLIGEACRLEPWVYTHYVANTAQSAHAGHPLGNQAGPNSLTADAKAYLRAPGRWYASARVRLLWKGTDAGSSLDDGAWEPGTPLRKTFLGGSDGPDVEFIPFVSWRWRLVTLEARATVGREFSPVIRAQVGL